MKKYQGDRIEGKISVTVDGKTLDPRFDLRVFCSDGFEWGYGGSGPAQLALALIADAVPYKRTAVELCHLFKWNVIATLPHESWLLTEDDVRRALSCL